MYRLYAAGHADGHPTPGGVACCITFGHVRIETYQHELSRTTPNQAALMAVRDGLHLITQSQRSTVQIITNRDFVRQVMTGERQLRQPDLATIQREINTAIRWNDLHVTTFTSAPNTLALLDETQQAAEDTAERAWLTLLPPNCPHCQTHMTLTRVKMTGYWRCSRSSKCHGKLDLYPTSTSEEST